MKTFLVRLLTAILGYAKYDVIQPTGEYFVVRLPRFFLPSYRRRALEDFARQLAQRQPAVVLPSGVVIEPTPGPSLMRAVPFPNEEEKYMGPVGVIPCGEPCPRSVMGSGDPDEWNCVLEKGHPGQHHGKVGWYW
jgi:hypothetical protein